MPRASKNSEKDQKPGLNTPATAGRAKYQHTGDRKSAKTWEEPELSALYAGMFAILKQNVSALSAIPEVKANGRTSSNIHKKLESLFKDKIKPTK